MSVEVSGGYKQTEAGILPEDWKCRKLSELIETNRAIRYGVVQPGIFDRSGVYMLRSQDYSKGWANEQTFFKVSPFLADQFKNARLRADDIVMTVVGAGVGQVVQIPQILEGSVLSRSTARIAVDNCVSDSSFVKYCLMSSLGQAQIPNFLKEGAQPVLSCNDLGKFPIPQPHIKEQRAIATALSDMDALISGLDQLIAKKRDIKQATMQQLLTGQTRLPGFSGEWEFKRLGDVTRLYQPVTISANQFSESGYPVYGANGIVGFYHNFNHEEWQVTITCRGSTCGTVNRTVGKSWITGNAMVVSCEHSSELNKDFLYYLLLGQDLSVCITGTGQPQIVRSPLASFEILYPRDFDEQAAIATILSDIDAELATLECRRDKAKQIKQGMMQELLTGRIRLPI